MSGWTLNFFQSGRSYFCPLCFLPFAQFDLSSPWPQRVEATDSSMSGLGHAFQ